MKKNKITFLLLVAFTALPSYSSEAILDVISLPSFGKNPTKTNIQVNQNEIILVKKERDINIRNEDGSLNFDNFQRVEDSVALQSLMKEDSSIKRSIGHASKNKKGEFDFITKLENIPEAFKINYLEVVSMNEYLDSVSKNETKNESQEESIAVGSKKCLDLRQSIFELESIHASIKENNSLSKLLSLDPEKNMRSIVSELNASSITRDRKEKRNLKTLSVIAGKFQKEDFKSIISAKNSLEGFMAIAQSENKKICSHQEVQPLEELSIIDMEDLSMLLEEMGDVTQKGPSIQVVDAVDVESASEVEVNRSLAVLPSPLIGDSTVRGIAAE